MVYSLIIQRRIALINCALRARQFFWIRNIQLPNKMCSKIALEEQDINDEENYGQWGNCPIELLIMIFTHLDCKTLAITMFVSKFWMDAVKYYCQHFNLWKQMVEENIANRGALYKEKCTLQWRELLMNFFLWRKVWKMTVFHHRNFNIKHVKTMKVYRDNLIVVFKNEVKYINLVDRDCNKTLNVKCLTYEESDYLLARMSREQHIRLYSSLYVLNKQRRLDNEVRPFEEFSLDVINSYKLHSNCCYLLDMSNTLWVAKTEHCNFTIKALAKFYGPRNSIIAMHVFEHRVYIVRKGGDVFYADGLQFKRAFNILLPSHNYNAVPFLFNKGSAAYRVPVDERFEIYELPRQNAVVIAGPGLTTLTEHGELVILGYDSGKIEIHSIYKVLACLNLPEKVINIKEFVYEEDGDYHIHAIDVYEEVDKHYLIVAIDGDVHQFRIQLMRKPNGKA